MQIALPSLTRPTGELGFWASLVDVLARFVRGALLTDEEERRLHLAAFAGLRLGHPIIHAESVDDLDDRIDAAIQDPELGRLSSIGFRSGGELPVTAVAAELTVTPALVEVFGRGAWVRLEEGDRLASAIARASGELRSGLGAGGRGWDTAPSGASPAFLSDPGVPAEVAEALLGGLKAAVCLAAIAQAALLRQKLQPWLSLAIADRWVEGQRAFLRLLASMPGVTVPEAVVAAGERLDLERLLGEARATEERLGELLEAAKASGEPIVSNGAEDTALMPHLHPADRCSPRRGPRLIEGALSA